LTTDIQARPECWRSDTGRAADELIEDALAGYSDELAITRELLNSRYDDLKSGKVKPVSRAEVRARLKARSEAWSERR
jgi:hypothetical protein